MFLAQLEITPCQTYTNNSNAKVKKVVFFLERIILNKDFPIFQLRSSNTSAQVNVSLWFKVGSRNDKPGKLGAAHLIEHSMLRIKVNGSTNMKDFLLKNAVEYKIITSIDFILLRFVCTKDKVMFVLQSLKEAFDEVRIDPKDFIQEKAIVKNEISIKIGSREKKYFDALRENIWSENVGHPILGDSLDIQSITVEEVINTIQCLWNRKDFFILYTGELRLDKLQSLFGTAYDNASIDQLERGPLAVARSGIINIKTRILDIPDYDIINASLIYPLKNECMSNGGVLMALLSRLIAYGDGGFLTKTVRSGKTPLYYIMAFPISFKFENVLVINFIANKAQVKTTIDYIQDSISDLSANLDTVSQYLEIVKQGFTNEIGKAQRSDFQAMNYIGQALLYGREVNRLEETIDEINKTDLKRIKTFSEEVFSTDLPVYFITDGRNVNYE